MQQPQPPAPPPPPDWDTLWQTVEANPSDFSAWEQILRMAEAADGGLDPTTAPKENISNCKKAFDRFLARFPLCFGYWKKYADLTLIMDGVQGAENVSSLSLSFD